MEAGHLVIVRQPASFFRAILLRQGIAARFEDQNGVSRKREARSNGTASRSATDDDIVVRRRLFFAPSRTV